MVFRRLTVYKTELSGVSGFALPQRHLECLCEGRAVAFGIGVVQQLSINQVRDGWSCCAKIMFRWNCFEAFDSHWRFASVCQLRQLWNLLEVGVRNLVSGSELSHLRCRLEADVYSYSAVITAYEKSSQWDTGTLSISQPYGKHVWSTTQELGIVWGCTVSFIWLSGLRFAPLKTRSNQMAMEREEDR